MTQTKRPNMKNYQVRLAALLLAAGGCERGPAAPPPEMVAEWMEDAAPHWCADHPFRGTAVVAGGRPYADAGYEVVGFEGEHETGTFYGGGGVDAFFRVVRRAGPDEWRFDVKSDSSLRYWAAMDTARIGSFALSLQFKDADGRLEWTGLTKKAVVACADDGERPRSRGRYHVGGRVTAR